MSGLQEDKFQIRFSSYYKKLNVSLWIQEKLVFHFIHKTLVYFFSHEISYLYDNDIRVASSDSLAPFHVVDKFSKAVGEDGLCKKPEMTSLFKPNFSTNVCGPTNGNETNAKMILKIKLLIII
ncbi:MAG TPA: hypothetical protein VMW55_08020 [Nitrosopumilaceae archaeon]|nr:hypothetical protein [Nitrosopumilaceae archaeon]